MKSYFAPAERSSENEFALEIESISKSSFFRELMRVISGLVAVLNDKRQILAVNDTMLSSLGIDDISAVLGARPGEALHCVHPHEMPGGCGTTKHCSTCGLAIALVTTLATNQTVEKDCFIETEVNHEKKELYFKVKASTIQTENEKFVLLFLQDFTRMNSLLELEKNYLNDMSSILTGLQVSCQTYNRKKKMADKEKIMERIQNISLRLIKDVEMQKSIIYNHYYNPVIKPISIKQIFMDLDNTLNNFKNMNNFQLQLEDDELIIHSDIHLTTKILFEMLKNAAEASEGNNEVVIIKTHLENKKIVFSVWNSGSIPEGNQLRIFQRHYTTKKDKEHLGFGTYTMKLFGEKFLGGEVSFSSNEKNGTEFFLKLPRDSK